MTINPLIPVPGGLDPFSPTSHLQHLDELRAEAERDRLGSEVLRARRAEARAARIARRARRRIARQGRHRPAEV